MDRRTGLLALFALLSAPHRLLGAVQRVPGVLTIDLDIYASILIKHDGKTIEQLRAELTQALAAELDQRHERDQARAALADLERQFADRNDAIVQVRGELEQETAAKLAAQVELERARKTIESSTTDGLVVNDGIKELHARLADAREALANSGLPADEVTRNELKIDLYKRLHTDPLVGCGRKMRALLPATAEAAREFDNLVQPIEAPSA